MELIATEQIYSQNSLAEMLLCANWTFIEFSSVIISSCFWSRHWTLSIFIVEHVVFDAQFLSHKLLIKFLR